MKTDGFVGIQPELVKQKVKFRDFSAPDRGGEIVEGTLRGAFPSRRGIVFLILKNDNRFTTAPADIVELLTWEGI
jgi:hypothetical protein